MYSGQKIDMVGKRYGMLTVINEIPERNKNNHIMYWCKCDCGNFKAILGVSIRQGLTKSCGCLHRNKITKHGMGSTPEYKAWLSMKSRCDNPKNPRYKDWGGRGIAYCREWSDFANFIKDMGLKPEPSASIERIDNDRGYFKENCKWATKREQALNRRTTVKVLHEGREMYVHEFAKSIGLTESGARKRLKNYKKIDGVFVKEV